MGRGSLRRRVLVALNLTTVLVTLLAAAAMIALVFWFERTLFYDHLGNDLDRFIALNRDAPYPIRQVWGEDQYYKMPVGDWSMLPEALRGYPAGAQEVITTEGTFNLVVRHEPRWTYVLAQDQTAFERFELLLFAFVLFFVVMVWLLGYRLSRNLADQILVPLARLADEVATSRARLGLTMAEDHESGDDLQRLQRMLDGYAREIEAMLERERRFTASVSHELRNPLMRIQAAAELLGEMTHEGGAGEALGRIRRAVATMDRQLRLHLALARESGPARDEPLLSADRVLEQLAGHWQEEAGRRGISFRFLPGEERLPEVPELLLAGALDNLIRNALEHGAGPVEVGWQGREIFVRDAGPGFSAEILAAAGRWGRSGSSTGHGYGLAIVSQICKRTGWQLMLRNPENGGGEAVIRL